MHKVVLQFGGCDIAQIDAFTKAVQFLTETTKDQVAEWIFVASPMLLRKTNQLAYVGYLQGDRFVRNRYKIVVAANRVLENSDKNEYFNTAVGYLADRLHVDLGSLEQSRLTHYIGPPAISSKRKSTGKGPRDIRLTGDALLIEGVLDPIDGYGHATENYVKGLAESHINIGLTTINSPAHTWDSDEAILKAHQNQGIKNIRSYLCFATPRITDTFRRLVNSKRTLLTMFETTSIPCDWPRIINEYDELIVPCNHNVHSFSAGGVNIPISVCSLGIRTDIYKYKQRPTNRPLKFLMFANSYWHEPRKNYARIPHLFREAFGNNPQDVELTVKLTIKDNITYPVFEGVNYMVERLGKPDLVKLVHDHDVLLFPSSGEGYCLPVREAMATGMPSIHVAWAGLEDINDSTSSLWMPPTRMKDAIWKGPHQAGLRSANKHSPYFGQFIDIDEDAFIDRMRWAKDNRDKLQTMGMAATKVINEKYSYQVASRRLGNLLCV